MSVAVVSRPGVGYPTAPPFDPPNPVYAAVEAMFAALGLDAARAGSPEWNPLGDLIAAGDRVLVKPNLVSNKDLHCRIRDRALLASSTHGALLRPVLDYALRAAGDEGRVDVVDCPVEGCRLAEVTAPLGIDAVIAHLVGRGRPVRLIDLRHFCVTPHLLLDDARRWGRSFNLGLLVRRRLAGDPRGYRVVDLAGRSCFAAPGAPAGERLRFHRSHYATPVPHHTGGRHEYSIGQTVLDADVVINLPKLKTHKKAGVTLSLKSAIGLSNEKYWLPHFTAGAPDVGGDELDRPHTLAERIGCKLSRLPLPGDHSLVARAPRLDRPAPVLDGGWEGNDTLWRTTLDLNRILLCCGRDGVLHDSPQRRYLSLVDGIVAGEGEGPLGATPVDAGLLVGGCDPVAVDHAAVAAMGFEPARIPTIAHAIGTLGQLPREVIRDGPAPHHRFAPPRSWPSLLDQAAR